MLASELIDEVRGAGSITPDTLDADILKAADAELRTRLLPMVRTLNEEYLVRTIDVAAVAGRVALPSRAMGAALRLVQVVNTGGQLGAPLPRMDPAYDSGAGSSGPPYGFYFDGGSVVLLPLGSSATVRLRYYARPGKLVLESDLTKCAALSNVIRGAVNTTYVIGAYIGPATVDFIAAGPAHQHKGIDLQNGPIANTDLFEPLADGDYLAAAGYTPMVALPEELGSTLALRTAARLLAGLGYLAEAKAQYVMADTAQLEAAELLRPRSDGNPKRLTGGVLARLGQAFPGPWGRW